MSRSTYVFAHVLIAGYGTIGPGMAATGNARPESQPQGATVVRTGPAIEHGRVVTPFGPRWGAEWPRNPGAGRGFRLDGGLQGVIDQHTSGGGGAVTRRWCRGPGRGSHERPPPVDGGLLDGEHGRADADDQRHVEAEPLEAEAG